MVKHIVKIVVLNILIWIMWCKQCLITANFANSKNEKIDDLIKEMRLKINSCFSIVFEWIPYNQFNDIERINKIDSIIATYSAVWEDGPFYYDYKNKMKWMRESDQKVILKYFLQNLVDELLNEV